MQDSLVCPNCGILVRQYRNPFLTVDIIIRIGRDIVLIERRNPPHGWALPGGFVDYGETLEEAARREAVITYPDQIIRLAGQLRESRRHAFRCLPDMALQLSAETGFPATDLEDYWRSMSYDLSEGHIEGLRLYFSLCHKHGLLPAVPEFHFFPAS